MGLMKEQAAKVENITEGFMMLQRAATVVEIACALGREGEFRDGLDAVLVLHAGILLKFEERLTKHKEEMAKKVNTVTKPIKDGTKTPTNNQGVKPSPKAGSTGAAKKATRRVRAVK